MKNILYFIIGIVLSTSCTNLDAERFDAIDPNNFPKTEKEAETLIVAGVYGAFNNNGFAGIFNCGNGVQIISEMTTDSGVCCWVNNAWTPLTHHNWDANHRYTTVNYTNYINFIGKMILTRERIKDVQMTDQAKTRMNAEISMGLGWLGYLLNDFYGPIPIPTLEQLNSPLKGEIIPRVSEAEMSNFIEKNLLDAIQGLPTRTDIYGRFDKGLAYTVLMKHYMQQKDWAKAEACGRELMKADYKYALMPSYESIFTIENENNSEVIFASTAKRGTKIQLWHDHALPGDYPVKNRAIQRWDGYKVPWAFYKTFDANDDRLSVLVGEYTGIGGYQFNEANDLLRHGSTYSGAVPVKYGEDPASTGDGSEIDWIVYRYADVITLLSEAIVRNSNATTQEAVDLLNMVRTRAKLPPYQLSEVSDVQTFLDKVLQERGHELWFEGARRTDLIRHGKFISSAQQRGSSTTKNEFVRFPLPQAAINEGKGIIIQNPGY